MISLSDLVTEVSIATGKPKTECKAILEAGLQAIKEWVGVGERVQLKDFGTFKPVQTRARTGRSPISGEEIQIRAKVVPRFTAAKGFRKGVEGAFGRV